MKQTLRKAVWFGVTALSVAVAVISYRYFNPWIRVHAVAAYTALLLGPVQFRRKVRRRWPTLHRWSGWTYCTSCLLGGCAGLILARGVSTGPTASAGFAALGALWLYVTTQGLRTARAADFSAHRRWMIRSFALTFAAVTLRIYLQISHILGLDFTTAYRAIAWLA